MLFGLPSTGSASKPCIWWSNNSTLHYKNTCLVAFRFRQRTENDSDGCENVSNFVSRHLKILRMSVFKLEDALSVWTNLCKYLLFAWLCVSSIKTGTRRIILLDELPFVVLLERRKIIRLHGYCVLCPSLYLRRITRRTTNVCPSSSRRIMRL